MCEYQGVRRTQIRVYQCVCVFVLERNTTFWMSGFMTEGQMSMSEVCDEHKYVCVCARACVCVLVVNRVPLAGYCSSGCAVQLRASFMSQ